MVGTACAEEPSQSRACAGKTLVAYLTRSGNTRVIAGTLQRALGADLFEIRAARPNPEDYEQHVAQATRERIGAAGTFLVGVLVYGDPATLARYVGVALIVGGVGTLKLAH